MTRELNQRIRHIEVPERMRHLPIDDRGYPIPYFVPFIDDKPEFRGMDGEKMGICVRHRRCWLCGQTMGQYLCFPIGPMCTVTRTIAEPPSHYECAKYGAMACPFLTQPRMRRNEKDIPEGATVAGIGLKRNPGVIALWTTRDYKIMRQPIGVLFKIGDPIRVEYWAEGRIATHDEIMHSIDTGLPILRDIAKQDGGDAPQQLELMVADALKRVPA
jgi:hypothetical protein